MLIPLALAVAVLWPLSVAVAWVVSGRRGFREGWDLCMNGRVARAESDRQQAEARARMGVLAGRDDDDWSSEG